MFRSIVRTRSRLVSVWAAFVQVVPISGGIAAAILNHIGVQDFILLARLQVKFPHYPPSQNNEDRY